VLVVTEKATNTISTYVVEDDGLTEGPQPQASVGKTPFGFAFSQRGTLVVSEAFGGAAGASALSSYDVSESGELEVVNASVGTSQTAACWVVITGDSRFAYTTNTGSGTTGAGPIDMALSGNDGFLYALNSVGGTISAFQVNADGSPTPQPGVDGLPAGVNGLAAR
jgi:6-phosphogluconolactonase